MADRRGFEPCVCHFDRWLHTAEKLRLTSLVGTQVMLRAMFRGSGDGRACAHDGLGTQEAQGPTGQSDILLVYEVLIC